MKYATHIGVNIGSGNGLVPGGTKPSPEPMLTIDEVQWQGNELIDLTQNWNCY